MILPAGWSGWVASHYVGTLVSAFVGAVVLSLAGPIMRTCLIVTDEAVVDRRALRTVRLPWQQIAGFDVERPGWLWGGFCIVAACKDGRHIDLLSTRAYTRAPSARHLDELQRLCWTLEDRLAAIGDSA